MRKHLESLTNIAIVIAAILFSISLIKHNFGTSRFGHQPDQLVPGVHLLAPHDYAWTSHERTLVLALQKGCIYCENSLPFYRKLAGLERSGTIKAHLLAVFPNNQPAVQAVLAEQDLQLDTATNVPLNTINVVGTPTVILLDNKGQVLASWKGQLTPDLENSVIQEAQK